MKLSTIPLAAVFALLSPSAMAEPLLSNATIASLGVAFTDMSTEGAYNGVRADETARTRLVEDYIVQRFREEGFQVLSTAPVSAQLAKVTNPAHCNGCDVKLGQELGAQYVVVSEVIKISNLIQSMNIQVRDTATGTRVKGMVVDIRGNTDAAWLRGMRYMFDNNIFKD